MAGAAWKSGRGALGVLKPLLGDLATETEGRAISAGSG
jgi:hypothetical protein